MSSGIDGDPHTQHPNDDRAVREHMRNSALALSNEERLTLLARIDAEIAELDRQSAPKE
jgi:hypothetical protein